MKVFFQVSSLLLIRPKLFQSFFSQRKQNTFTFKFFEEKFRSSTKSLAKLKHNYLIITATRETKSHQNLFTNTKEFSLEVENSTSQSLNLHCVKNFFKNLRLISKLPHWKTFRKNRIIDLMILSLQAQVGCLSKL